MTAVGNAFQAEFGMPQPRTAPGFSFPAEWDQLSFDMVLEQIGAGWFMDGFLYFLGDELAYLDTLLQHWFFLFADEKERRVIGKNAYGALLVVENPKENGIVSMVGMVDPLTVSYYKDPNLDFTGLIGNWLPQHKLPRFLDRSIYQAFQESTQKRLLLNQVLGIKIPLSLGGELELDNFQVEPLDEYYVSITEIYRKAKNV